MRSGELKRTEWKRKPPKRKVVHRIVDPVSQATKDEVLRRSGGLCEAETPVCPPGRRWAQHRHHRKLRRHRDHSAANLMHVAWVCHEWIHKHVKESRERGWLLRSTDNPEEIPWQ